MKNKQKTREPRTKEVYCNLIDIRDNTILKKNVKLPIWNINYFNTAFSLNCTNKRYMRIKDA